MSDENGNIGERIKSERLRLRMTQPDFAGRANASKRALIEWEKGNTGPDSVFAKVKKDSLKAFP